MPLTASFRRRSFPLFSLLSSEIIILFANHSLGQLRTRGSGGVYGGNDALTSANLQSSFYSGWE